MAHKNILIIKIGALGDVVRSSFIAQALRDKYSRNGQVRITWVTSKMALSLFMNNPYVNRVLDVDNINLVRNEKFDIVVNLEEDEKSCKFTSEIKPNKIIGFYYKDGKVMPTESAKEWFNMSALGVKPMNDFLKKRNKKTHRQIMGEIAGVNWEKYEPFLRLTNKQRNIASDFMRRHNISRKDIVVGVNTGAADRWPKSLSVKKTAQLIELIYQKYKAKILLFGGPNEIERNKEILKIVKSPVIDTGCGNDLIEFPALISTCGFFITSDSLGLHISLALKRKTICLIGPTSNSEIGMYDMGNKVIAKSDCLCCYKKDCKSMEKIDVKEVFSSFEKLIKQKITLIITAFKEPNISKAIESALNQKTNYEYEIIVSAPDEETINIARKYVKKDKRISIIKDPGKGKSYALNMIFNKIKTDILILTDGDVFISNNSVEEIVDLFNNPEIGCVTGRPIPMESKETKYGYWANFLFDAAHSLRREAFSRNNFIECSGYLFAFRKNKIKEIPLDVAEDSVIPYFFWEKGYSIGYAEKAKVYVRNVNNFKDWIKQKTRTSKAHETLNKYVDVSTTKRVKSFSTESKGAVMLFEYPSDLNQFFWTLELFFARLYMWGKVIIDTKLKNKNYGDAWERIESTK